MANNTKPIQKSEQRLAWYQEAKFGLFIHWGAYAVAGVEASWPIMAPELSAAMFGTQKTITEDEYLALPSKFNPLKFNADEWVKLAREAGMRYIVITSKHHDGFCMFDAPGTDYKITNTPYGKDICLELAQACTKFKMPLGFYYSPPDMHHPGYRDTKKPATKNWTGEPNRKEWNEYLDYMESHIRKLLTDYGEISIIWFDGLTNHGKYDPQRFHNLIHELSPNTLINDRLGDGFDYITPEQFIPKKGIPASTGKPPSGIDPGGDGFFRLVSSLVKVPLIGGWLRKQMKKYGEGTLELTPVHQEAFPSPDHFQPWETCMTMGQSWAHNPTETDWKTPRTLLENLIRVVSRGGNYLLNIGPTAQGEFPSEAVERLEIIGRWMKTYNQAIYGTTYTPLNDLPWGQATRKEDKLFLHVFDWPANGIITIENFPDQVKSVNSFDGKKLELELHNSQLAITLPPEKPGLEIPVIVVNIDHREKGWVKYSAPVSTKVASKKYIQNQAVASGIINAIINGLIAFFTYKARVNIPFAEAAYDIPITVFILGFLVPWLTIGSARNVLVKGNIASLPSPWRNLYLPKGPALGALIISVVLTIFWGILILDGSIYLLIPNGFSNWAYILFKTLYTGATAALASAITILSVFKEKNRS